MHVIEQRRRETASVILTAPISSRGAKRRSSISPTTHAARYLVSWILNSIGACWASFFFIHTCESRFVQSSIRGILGVPRLPDGEGATRFLGRGHYGKGDRGSLPH